MCASEKCQCEKHLKEWATIKEWIWTCYPWIQMSLRPFCLGCSHPISPTMLWVLCLYNLSLFDKTSQQALEDIGVCSLSHEKCTFEKREMGMEMAFGKRPLGHLASTTKTNSLQYGWVGWKISICFAEERLQLKTYLHCDLLL